VLSSEACVTPARLGDPTVVESRPQVLSIDNPEILVSGLKVVPTEPPVLVTTMT
jgi:hypothetical protein